jgi:hypothetical protein
MGIPDSEPEADESAGSLFAVFVGSPYRIAERSPVNMNLTAKAPKTSIVHPLKFRCLWVIRAITQMITSPEHTRSAIDSPIIQKMRVITNQYRPERTTGTG